MERYIHELEQKAREVEAGVLRVEQPQELCTSESPGTHARRDSTTRTASTPSAVLQGGGLTYAEGPEM